MIFTTNEKYEQAILSTLIHIQTHLEGDLNLDMLADASGSLPIISIVSFVKSSASL